MRFLPSASKNVQITVLGERLIVLRDLIALGQVRIEIVLSGESRKFLNLTVKCYGRADRKLDRLPAQHRQSARQPETNRTYIGIRRRPKLHRAATKDLGLGPELNVYFEANHRLVLGQNAFSGGARGHVPIVGKGQVGARTLIRNVAPSARII